MLLTTSKTRRMNVETFAMLLRAYCRCRKLLIASSQCGSHYILIFKLYWLGFDGTTHNLYLTNTMKNKDLCFVIPALTCALCNTNFGCI